MSIGRILEFDISNSGIPLPRLFLHHKLDLIQIGPPLPASRDYDEAIPLKLLDELVHAGFAHAHLRSKTVLSGKAAISVPCVVKEHGVRHLCTQTQRAIRQNEIR